MLIPTVLVCGLVLAIGRPNHVLLAHPVPAEPFRQLAGPPEIEPAARKAVRLAASYQRTGNAGAAEFYRQMAARLVGRSVRG